MPVYVHFRVLGICFLRYQENSHPENFHQLNSPLVNPPWKIPTWNVSTHVFKYSHSRFLIFFSLLLLLSLKLLKRRFCNFMFWKCWSQNKVLSDERQLMKWMGIFQVRIFWVAIFRWGREFSRESLMGGNFSGGNTPVGISLEPFSLFNGSILIFQKIMNKYNKTFNKKIYILIQCRAKFLSRKILFQWAQIIFNSKHVKQRKFWVLNKWSVREKCKS